MAGFCRGPGKLLPLVRSHPQLSQARQAKCTKLASSLASTHRACSFPHNQGPENFSNHCSFFAKNVSQGSLPRLDETVDQFQLNLPLLSRSPSVHLLPTPGIHSRTILKYFILEKESPGDQGGLPTQDRHLIAKGQERKYPGLFLGSPPKGNPF